MLRLNLGLACLQFRKYRGKPCAVVCPNARSLVQPRAVRRPLVQFVSKSLGKPRAVVPVWAMKVPLPSMQSCGTDARPNARSLVLIPPRAVVNPVARPAAQFLYLLRAALRLMLTKAKFLQRLWRAHG